MDDRVHPKVTAYAKETIVYRIPRLVLAAFGLLFVGILAEAIALQALTENLHAARYQSEQVRAKADEVLQASHQVVDENKRLRAACEPFLNR